jgi:hypothetical protein
MGQEGAPPRAVDVDDRPRRQTFLGKDEVAPMINDRSAAIALPS